MSIAAPTLLADTFPEQPWGADSDGARCVVCHSLEQGGPFRVAPNLWGIVGAEKARDRAWFAYSPALIRKGGTWTEEELDAYLEDAAAFAQAPPRVSGSRIRTSGNRSSRF